MTETAEVEHAAPGRGKTWPWVAALVVSVGACGALKGANEDEPYDMNNPLEAVAQCEGFAKKRLKAPATAEFNLRATHAEAWVVTGTVDSHNGFGAMVRSDVRCVIQMDNTSGRARLLEIDLG